MIVFFFNDTATTEIYSLSLHDALPISGADGHRALGGDADQDLEQRAHRAPARRTGKTADDRARGSARGHRSEEHTSELQSRQYLVCRLLLGKKKHRHRQALRPSTASAY